MSLIAELRRRNIFRVAVLYAAASWLLLDLCALCVAELGLAPWVFRFLAALALICFPLAMVLSWIYEITPEGLRRERDVIREQSITPLTGRRLVRITLVLIALIALSNLLQLILD